MFATINGQHEGRTMNWIELNLPFGEGEHDESPTFCGLDLNNAGTLIRTADGEFLMGHINRLGGECDCPPGVVGPDTIVLAYCQVWADGEAGGMWIVGRGDPAMEWDCIGVFTTEAGADAACISSAYFMAPALINQAMTHGSKDWPGLRYPRD